MGVWPKERAGLKLDLPFRFSPSCDIRASGAKGRVKLSKELKIF